MRVAARRACSTENMAVMCQVPHAEQRPGKWTRVRLPGVGGAAARVLKQEKHPKLDVGVNAPCFEKKKKKKEKAHR